MIAPRPVYIASADQDIWAYPLGEFLSAKEASKVYNLCGKSGLENINFPPINQPILNTTVGYHIRSGEHDLKEYDWEQFLKFTKIHIA